MTLVNSQRENTNSKGDFFTQRPVRIVRFKNFWYTKKNLTEIYWNDNINCPTIVVFSAINEIYLKWITFITILLSLPTLFRGKNNNKESKQKLI